MSAPGSYNNPIDVEEITSVEDHTTTTEVITVEDWASQSFDSDIDCWNSEESDIDISIDSDYVPDSDNDDD